MSSRRDEISGWGGAAISAAILMSIFFMFQLSDWSSEIEAEEYIMLKGLVAEFPEELTPIYTGMLNHSQITGDERNILLRRWERLRKQKYAADELRLNTETTDDELQ